MLNNLSLAEYYEQFPEIELALLGKNPTEQHFKDYLMTYYIVDVQQIDVVQFKKFIDMSYRNDASFRGSITTIQPHSPNIGEVFFDTNTNTPMVFNGNEYISIASNVISTLE